MPAKAKIAVILLLILDIILLLWILIHGKTIAILEPQGVIAGQEKQLILLVFFLGLAIILPTVLLFYYFTFRYREANTKTKYNPDGTGGPRLQFFFWTFPCFVVIFFILLIWQSSHALDPFKPLSSAAKPMTIQVVALRWKWLFIYPKEKIATVNYVAFPEKTPVTFELTAEGPMNSFWIPRLGGQMYAMEGMVNKTHLMADTTGEYEGSTAEISGEGFAGMRFLAKTTTKKDFSDWVENVKQSGQNLSWKKYTKLAKPTIDNQPAMYVLKDDSLYNEIVGQFMAPSSMPSQTQTLGAHDMNMQGMSR